MGREEEGEGGGGCRFSDKWESDRVMGECLCRVECGSLSLLKGGENRGSLNVVGGRKAKRVRVVICSTSYTMYILTTMYVYMSITIYN